MLMNIPSPVRRMFSLMLLAALAVMRPVFGAPPPGIPDGWSDGFVYANGIRIHYYHAKVAAASGKPVMVMIHGVTDIGLSWTTLTWKLQDAYDIYMVDARGHGLTDPFMPGDDGDTLIKDVVEFVRVMKFEKPVLMGHSMGGATVIRVGAEYPDLARAIVVLDAGVGRRPGGRAPAAPGVAAGTPPPPSSPTSDPLAFSMVASPEILAKQNNYSFDELVVKCRRESPKWDFVDCQYWALSKKQYHGPYSNEAWQAMSGSMRAGDSLGQIPVPVLILKADASPEARKGHLEAASVLQNGKLVHIDGSGHNLHHDQLARTVEVLNDFLSTL
jgi:pimeloyl-ACP methyl ester carboxylesterase